MRMTFYVDGMQCDHCKKMIERGLKSIKGINKVKIDLIAKTVTTEQKETVSPEQITGKITELGYKVIK